MQGSNKAKSLRQNQTEAEKHLWQRLRNRGLNDYKFRRQVPIGSYIADFVCMELRLIVEVDGGQHADQIAYDQKRELFLRKEGYEIVRYWNNEVLGNLDGVLETLTLALSLRERDFTPPSPQPSP
ncbi:MAG: endonuclease domain-containing protein [Gallionella sp.]